MLDPEKYTPQYIAKADTDALNQERKELIRLYVAYQDVARRLREELVRRGEESKAVEEVAGMDPVKRAAIEKALTNARTTGSGRVS